VDVSGEEAADGSFPVGDGAESPRAKNGTTSGVRSQSHRRAGDRCWNRESISAREQGRTPEEASNAANLSMKEVRHVVPE